MVNHPKSFETVLEEERKEILAMLEKERPSRKPKGRAAFIDSRRASSPLVGTQPPVRSMLDIGLDPTHAQSSLTGMRTESPSPPLTAPIRSMLDIHSPRPENMAEGQARINNLQHRSLSDTTPRPTYLVSREPGVDLSLAYKFSGYLPSNPVAVIPRWNTSAGRKLSGSNSPRSSMLNPDASKIVLADGSILDTDKAYHRLSDIGIFESESGDSSRRASSGETNRPDPSALGKDHATPEDEDAIAESSDDDDHSSDDEQPRGRNKESRSRDGSEGKPLSTRASAKPRSALGRAAAADRDGMLL